MENKKDIGRAFREKLDGLQKPAPDAGWNSISAQLRQTKMPAKFPWFRISVISCLVIIISLIITYPLWNSHVPRIYMEMPGGQKAGDSTNIREKETGGYATDVPEKPDDMHNANDIQDNNKSQKNTIHLNKRAKRNPLRTIPPVAVKDTTVIDSNVEHMDNTIENNPTIILPVPEAAYVITKDTMAAAPVATKSNDEEEGKFKITDLSGIKYGTYTLGLAKKPDFRHIADSLDKVYGREKTDRKNKKSNNVAGTNTIRIAFTIPANVQAPDGYSRYYVQIMDPEGNIIGEKATIDLGGSKLMYSLVTTAFYENKSITINELVTGKDFIKGLYHVNVYSKDQLIASTTLTVN